MLIASCAVSVTEGRGVSYDSQTGSRTLGLPLSATEVCIRHGTENSSSKVCCLPPNRGHQVVSLRYSLPTESFFEVGIKAVLISRSAARKAASRRLCVYANRHHIVHPCTPLTCGTRAAALKLRDRCPDWSIDTARELLGASLVSSLAHARGP